MLLVINGAPGVGKSTLARMYAEQHPLSLVIDTDQIRTQLGQWKQVEESRAVARDLAVAMARSHLSAGHMVIVPQYIGRPEFLVRLHEVAGECGTEFREIVLTASVEVLVQRFLRRRNELTVLGVEHPETELSGEHVEATIARAHDAVMRDCHARDAIMISAGSGADAALAELLRALK